ncbi:hypothetical protein C8R46DRAFT_1354248 [Mycena filopes]|nr:hypothetical protein C8R46DRAFT_1354248 [Mycena filopes]
MEVDGDVFSCILSHISDARTLYSILAALPTSHLLFPWALARLWQLPVYLDTYDSRVAATSHAILDYLLEDNKHPALAQSVRHLVVAVEHKRQKNNPIDPPIPARITAFHERLTSLLAKAVNLRSLDYHSFPGLGLNSEHMQCLSTMQWFRHFSVDCAVHLDHFPPVTHAVAVLPGELSAAYDAANWELDPFITTVGPNLTSLELRRVNQTMFAALVNHTDAFASYHNLEHLKIDITEGVWDWSGEGAPSRGAEPGFNFPCLKFPSVKRFELIVCDKTMIGPERGPLNLVHCNLLTSLTIEVRTSLSWVVYARIKLFEALDPLDFPALAFLEISDNTGNWETEDRHLWNREGRAYPGLVSSFLGAIDAGALPSLTSVWVDERVLIPRGISVQNLLASAALPSSASYEPINIVSWTRSLRAAFAQLDSLRVGFGAINDFDAELILELCDPERLTQFGFEWNWFQYERDEPLAPGLLGQLSRFPKLTDVHILFPRPDTHLLGLADPDIDEATLADVAAIFKCNEIVCRVGIGNSLVWERHPSDPSEILLVSDGSVAANPAVLRFYHAGYLARDHSDESSNNAMPRGDRRAEIEQFRGLLERIVM